jgi:hypothetical protein
MMDSNQSLFSLSIDPVTKEHLSETAKWAKFLSVIGMIFLVVGIIFGLSGIWFSSVFDPAGSDEMSTMPSPALGVFMAAYMFVIAVIWFFPLLYLYRFAARMRVALNGNDQQALNTSFQNLKMCIRFVGIVTIIGLALTILGIVIVAISVSAAG